MEKDAKRKARSPCNPGAKRFFVEDFDADRETKRKERIGQHVTQERFDGKDNGISTKQRKS